MVAAVDDWRRMDGEKHRRGEEEEEGRGRRGRGERKKKKVNLEIWKRKQRKRKEAEEEEEIWMIKRLIFGPWSFCLFGLTSSSSLGICVRAPRRNLGIPDIS
ncbi:hypothetical protein LINPERPRIM_LOCUS32540 [Linum perenne]